MLNISKRQMLIAHASIVRITVENLLKNLLIEFAAKAERYRL